LTYVVNENCIRCKTMDCVEVCPVDCFYEGENMLVIHPDECIDCGVCEPECPVDAIKPDTELGLEKCAPRAHHPDYFFSRGSGRKSAAITGEYCLSCAEFVPTSSCDRAVVHPVSCPIGWVTRPERNCGASLVGTLSPGVAPGHPVARSIRHYH